ncbi:hypothetical protein CAPTEDRAFT_207067 [Capitella teleta]|uniref:Uncharacterized protein n=1 Tax=Capitella teleta TaxID=283909 RepID=R7VEX1_CAPTE|nr:hypothetical protein CAPTEDRAFT_207067 [Capitella teleta]|eukprot:ELU17403.1 hypothetical protein CAPTEDRAFT_207067 [Capitella teleta]
MDESIRSVAQPVWQVPFGLKEKVDGKLKKLLDEDIIEESQACCRRTGSATGLCVFLRLTVDQRLSKPNFLIIEFNLTPSKRVCEEGFKSASRLRLHEAACKSKKLKGCYELAQENKTSGSEFVTKPDHDKHLFAVLDRLRDVGSP